MIVPSVSAGGGAFVLPLEYGVSNKGRCHSGSCHGGERDLIRVTIEATLYYLNYNFSSLFTSVYFRQLMPHIGGICMASYLYLATLYDG